MLLVYRGLHAHYLFIIVFSDFAVFGGLGGFQPQFFFAGDPQISSEMTLAKKNCNRIKGFQEKNVLTFFVY